MKVQARFNENELAAVVAALRPGPLKRAMKKAGSTALRDMKSETSKRVRAQKRLKARKVKEAIKTDRPRGRVPINGMEWSLRMMDRPIPLTEYPHSASSRGVLVKVNKGQSSRLRDAFLRKSKRTGKPWILRRETKGRYPLSPLFGSRAVDAMLKRGEPEHVLERGRASFGDTFVRVLPMELEKAKKKKRRKR